MSERNPLPEWFQDFHDQKTIVKGFYVYLDMLDRQQELDYGKMFNYLNPRRVDLDWTRFHVNLVSFIEFLDYCGYRIVRKSKDADVLETSRELVDLDLALSGLHAGYSGPHPVKEWVKSKIMPWLGWRRYFPACISQDKIDEVISDGKS